MVIVMTSVGNKLLPSLSGALGPRTQRVSHSRLPECVLKAGHIVVSCEEWIALARIEARSSRDHEHMPEEDGG